MATQPPKRWTLAEVHALPADDMRRELVRGELFVTPPPSAAHEAILVRLARMLERFVAKNALGTVQRPPAAIRADGNEIIPDLMVRQLPKSLVTDWDDTAMPILVVEVVSKETRRRDHLQKRDLYLDAGIPEYWIVDPDGRDVRVIRPGTADEIATERFSWSPAGAAGALPVDVPALFV